MENSNVKKFPKEKKDESDSSLVSSLSPREIVSELDRYVVGQNKAKKAVAIALRNRWRRQAICQHQFFLCRYTNLLNY